MKMMQKGLFRVCFNHVELLYYNVVYMHLMGNRISRGTSLLMLDVVDEAAQLVGLQDGHHHVHLMLDVPGWLLSSSPTLCWPANLPHHHRVLGQFSSPKLSLLPRFHRFNCLGGLNTLHTPSSQWPPCPSCCSYSSSSWIRVIILTCQSHS